MAASPLLVVGLGNPGPAYSANRHNVGYMAVDAIAERNGWGPFRKRFHGELAEGNLNGRRILLLKPTTYMNDSGRAVATAARFFKVPPEDILVLHDELDLAARKLRVKRGGGHAGHNGLRSLHAHIGPTYRRVRLGIGHPGGKERVVGHVLNDFAKTDREWLTSLLDAIAEHFPLLAADEDGAFMSKVALTLNPTPEKPPRPAEDPRAGRTEPGNGV